MRQDVSTAVGQTPRGRLCYAIVVALLDPPTVHQFPQTVPHTTGEDVLGAGDDQGARDGCVGYPSKVADQPQLAEQLLVTRPDCRPGVPGGLAQRLKLVPARSLRPPHGPRGLSTNASATAALPGDTWSDAPSVIPAGHRGRRSYPWRRPAASSWRSWRTARSTAGSPMASAIHGLGFGGRDRGTASWLDQTIAAEGADCGLGCAARVHTTAARRMIAAETLPARHQAGTTPRAAPPSAVRRGGRSLQSSP